MTHRFRAGFVGVLQVFAGDGIHDVPFFVV